MELAERAAGRARRIAADALHRARREQLTARFLFAFVGGAGHAEPLVPLATAARAAGHAVAFTGRPAVVRDLAQRGFEVHPSGDDVPPGRLPLRPVDREHERAVLGGGFAGRIARERATAVAELARSWRADAIVCDEIDFGAMVAAERLGIPHASVLVTAPGFVRPSVIEGPLAGVRADAGLPPDPELAMLRRHLVLSPFPPSYRDPDGAELMRGDGAAAEPHERTTVYFTLGTVVNVESGDLFQRVLAGLLRLDVDVIATVGPQIDPAELGPQPPGVRVERHLPQDDALPRCDAVVTHGGSGTVLGALAHGLPLVLLPLGADQPDNAERCEQLGVGRALDAIESTPADVAEAVSGVLEEPSYGAAARRLRDEIASMPDAARALGLLEVLR